MTIIAIFCDGTWSSQESGARTHVSRLFSACAQDDGQTLLYIDGVGTGTDDKSALGKWISKIGGGLFGWGLNRTIKTAYRDLCKIYRPGDKIMIFGFSRGAYTARSLTGMIRKCGILNDPTPVNLDRAFRLYRKRGVRNMPDAPRIRLQRQKLSPRFATSQADILTRQNDSGLVRISYLGVWDTVGALGIPESLFGRLARWLNGAHAFHDTTLSHLVESARHAVALDERRAPFTPSLWDNLVAQGGTPGLNRGDDSPTRPYQQIWFVGDHGSVGGTGETRALSAFTLSWIWQGAAAQGLRLKDHERVPKVTPDASAATREIDDIGAFYRVFPRLRHWRQGPVRAQDLDDSARLRLATVPSYRPGSLFRLMPGLLRGD